MGAVCASNIVRGSVAFRVFCFREPAMQRDCASFDAARVFYFNSPCMLEELLCEEIVLEEKMLDN